MTWRAISVVLWDEIYEIEVRGEASLAPRWWRWTEYEWVRSRSGIGYQSIVGHHRVLFLELRYPAALDPYLLAVREDGHLLPLMPHHAFPIMDDSEALGGTQEAYRAAVERLSLAPRLL